MVLHTRKMYLFIVEQGIEITLTYFWGIFNPLEMIW